MIFKLPTLTSVFRFAVCKLLMLAMIIVGNLFFSQVKSTVYLEKNTEISGFENFHVIEPKTKVVSIKNKEIQDFKTNYYKIKVTEELNVKIKKLVKLHLLEMSNHFSKIKFISNFTFKYQIGTFSFIKKYKKYIEVFSKVNLEKINKKYTESFSINRFLKIKVNTLDINFCIGRSPPIS